MRPFPILLGLFLAVPIAEMYVLIQVGSQIGALATIGLVVLTAVVGAALMRSQGMATMNNIQMSMAQGKMPAMELAEGAAILFAGALLLTPGFITDTLGFLCLTPIVRQGLIRKVIASRMRVAGASFSSRGFGAGPAGPNPSDGFYRGPTTGSRPTAERDRGKIIEGEYRHEDE